MLIIFVLKFTKNTFLEITLFEGTSYKLVFSKRQFLGKEAEIINSFNVYVGTKKLL